MSLAEDTADRWAEDVCLSILWYLPTDRR